MQSARPLCRDRQSSTRFAVAAHKLLWALCPNTPEEELILNMKPETGCTPMQGSMPAPCAPMAYPFIAMQNPGSPRYESSDGLKNGTLFPGLNLPFHLEIQSRFPSIPAPLAEIMALDFAIQELGLYLDTHSDDSEALELFNTYVKLAQQGRMKYEELYGPLTKQYVTEDGSFTWVNNPWPWDLEGAKK